MACFEGRPHMGHWLVSGGVRDGFLALFDLKTLSLL